MGTKQRMRMRPTALRAGVQGYRLRKWERQRMQTWYLSELFRRVFLHARTPDDSTGEE